MSESKLAAQQPDPAFVVLGATGGIGSVLCRRLAADSFGRIDGMVNLVGSMLLKPGLTEALTSSEVARKVSESMHALGRLGEPLDIADAIAWLLDGRAGWVTGQVFGIDGGLATVRPRTKV